MFRTIYNRIRLLMLRHKEPYVLYHKLLGFYPTDIHLYEQACLLVLNLWNNISATMASRIASPKNSSRSLLMRRPCSHIEEERCKEGFLTNTRAKIVKRVSLNEIAVKLGLDNFITYYMRTSSHNNYMFGNAFEALIGAIYLDKGYRYCKKFVEQCFLLYDVAVIGITVYLRETFCKYRTYQLCRIHLTNVFNKWQK